MQSLPLFLSEQGLYLPSSPPLQIQCNPINTITNPYRHLLQMSSEKEMRKHVQLCIMRKPNSTEYFSIISGKYLIVLEDAIFPDTPRYVH